MCGVGFDLFAGEETFNVNYAAVDHAYIMSYKEDSFVLEYILGASSKVLFPLYSCVPCDYQVQLFPSILTLLIFYLHTLIFCLSSLMLPDDHSLKSYFPLVACTYFVFYVTFNPS